MEYGDITAIDPMTLNILNQAQGDILYYNGTNWVRLPAGTSGQRLETNGAAANPSWETDPSIPLPTDLNITSQATGTVLYYNGANWVILAAGTADQILTAHGAAAPTWEDPSGGAGSGTASFLGINGYSTTYNTTGIQYTETFDTGSDFTNTTGIFTCPQTGIYLFTASATFNCGNGGNYWGLMQIGGVFVGRTSPCYNAVKYATSGSVILSKSSGNNVSVGFSGTITSGNWSGITFSGTLLA